MNVNAVFVCRGWLHRRALSPLVILAVISILMSRHAAVADDLTWDADGSTAGQVDGGGIWNNLGNDNWWDGLLNVQWDNSNGDTAIFGVANGAAGTVNIAAGGVTAGGLTFNAPGSGNYTIASDTLTLTGSANITANHNATITSIIADGGSGFTKLGSAKLTVGNTANTFTGPLVVAEGTYSISAWNNVSANGPMGNSAGPITLGGGATQGTLEYAGGAMLPNSSLKAINVASGGGTIQLTMGGTRNTSYVHLDGTSLTGSGNLVVDTSNGGVNTSRFIMVGASSFTGDITVNANSELQTNSIFTGDIASFGVGSSGFGPAITMNSGSVITIYGPGQTPSVLVASLNGPADSTLRAESGTNIFKIGGDGSDSNFAGTFINAGGAGGITKVGAGTLTLSGASSFTAAVNINGGIVSVPTVADTGNNSPLGAGTAATGFNGGTLRYTGTTGSTNRNATLNAGGGTVQVDQAAETLTLAGDITGTGALTKTGPGTLSLTGAANTYSGLTTVGNGTLQIANWNGATAFALNDQTTLLYTGAGGSQAASKGLALPGTAGQSATINVQDPAAILNFASAGSNTVTGDGDLVKEGPGTLQLAQASVSQNWNGKTTINAGSVDYFGGGSMLRTVAAADAFTINDGATFKLTYTGGSSTIGTNNGFVIGSAIDDNATFEIYTGATFVHQFNNVISGPGNFIKTGTGNMGLANVNTFTGTVTLDDGAISLGTWNQAGTNGSWGNRPNTTAGTDFIQMAGATINYTGGNAGGNLRGVNLVSGNNVINITNAGATLNFQGGGWNTFQGNGGNLIKEGPGTLQIGAAGVANNVFNGSKVVINAGTLEWWGAGSMPSPGGFGASDAITINNGGTFRLSYGDVPTVVNSAIGFRLSGDATVSSNAPTADHTIAGVVADKVASTGNLIKAGAGILGLSNINTYTGNTIINAGTLRLTTAGTNNIASSPLIHLTGVGTNLNVTGVTGGFTLASGQMLQGIGTVTGNSTVGAGSFLSPGNSPGTTPFVGNHTWAGLGTLVWEINDATGNFGVEMDLITVSALLDITATTGSKFNIDIVGLDAGNAVGVVPGFNNLFDYAWLIADAGSTVSSFDADKFNLLTSNFTANNPLGGGTFGIVRGDAPGIGGDDTQLFLTFTPVPEPSSLALLALGLISLNLFRRRQ